MSRPIRLGIFGWPVAHSKSPEMHRAAADALGIELEYERFAVPPEELRDAIERAHATQIDGYNLTVPHKEAVLALLDEVDPSARAIGAVNTVVRESGGYVGYNTDAPGLVRSLVDAGVPVTGCRAVVLGAGGAARAGVVGLADAGAAHIAVLARREKRAEELVHGLVETIDTPLEHGALGSAARWFGDADLVVQATSATLGSNPEASAFATSLPLEALPERAAVLDMVYQPRVTAVLSRARDQGLRIVDGLGMLLHQGALAFERWTGREAPIRVMRAVLEAAG